MCRPIRVHSGALPLRYLFALPRRSTRGERWLCAVWVEKVLCGVSVQEQEQLRSWYILTSSTSARGIAKFDHWMLGAYAGFQVDTERVVDLQ